MTKEEITEVKYTIAQLLEALSHYIGCNNNGCMAYWETYEEYAEFNQDIANACNILEKELAKCK